MNTTTVFVEHARIISQKFFAGQQIVMRLHAPNCAKTAAPGQFIHLRCSTELAMRRPYAIMRVHRSAGWLEILYRVVGRGSRLLSMQAVGQVLSSMGPIGHGFDVSGCRRPLLLGGGLGMPPILFLAQHLHQQQSSKPLILLASERGFPFRLLQSKLKLDGFSYTSQLNHQWLERWGIAGRLCSQRAKHGCFQGSLTDMAEHYLAQLPDAMRRQHALFVCGPTAMMQQAAAVAQRWQLDCQLCLEEFMACAVGGCAACAVEVTDQHGQKTMQRVCVDGPVFKAQEIYPQQHNDS